MMCLGLGPNLSGLSSRYGVRTQAFGPSTGIYCSCINVAFLIDCLQAVDVYESSYSRLDELSVF